MSIESRLVHSAIGVVSWVMVACSTPGPQIAESVLAPAPITTPDTKPEQTDPSKEVFQADRFHGETLLSVAKRVINEDYLEDSAISYRRVSYEPATGKIWGIVELARGEQIQPFIVTNKYNKDGDLVETEIQNTNELSRRISFLPDQPFENSRFQETEQLQLLPSTLYRTPDQFQWKDDSWYQQIPGINFIRSVGETESRGVRYTATVEIQRADFDPSLANMDPMVRLQITYPEFYLTPYYAPEVIKTAYEFINNGYFENEVWGFDRRPSVSRYPEKISVLAQFATGDKPTLQPFHIINDYDLNGRIQKTLVIPGVSGAGSHLNSASLPDQLLGDRPYQFLPADNLDLVANSVFNTPDLNWTRYENTYVPYMSSDNIPRTFQSSRGEGEDNQGRRYRVDMDENRRAVLSVEYPTAESGK